MRKLDRFCHHDIDVNLRINLDLFSLGLDLLAPGDQDFGDLLLLVNLRMLWDDKGKRVIIVGLLRMEGRKSASHREMDFTIAIAVMIVNGLMDYVIAQITVHVHIGEYANSRDQRQEHDKQRNELEDPVEAEHANAAAGGSTHTDIEDNDVDESKSQRKDGQRVVEDVEKEERRHQQHQGKHREPEAAMGKLELLSRGKRFHLLTMSAAH